MSRLRRIKKKVITKTASNMLILDSTILKSGDTIGISARIVNWKAWYNVYLEYDAGSSSSFYDGEDFDKAIKMYTEMLIAFKGVSVAEEFSRSRNILEKKVNQLVGMKETTYHNLILKSPKFLGFDYY